CGRRHGRWRRSNVSLGNRFASKSVASSPTGRPRRPSQPPTRPMLNTLTQPHDYTGKLFVVEGIDGSGKTTQLGLLAKWLSAEGHRVFVTEWKQCPRANEAATTGT